MAKSIYVSMMPCDWRSTYDSFEKKLHRLVKICAKSLPTTAVDTNPLHIVIAPEYTFRNNPWSVVTNPADSHFIMGDSLNQKQEKPTGNFHNVVYKNTFYSSSQRDILIQKMIAVSANKNLLVIPGTITWTERDPVFPNIGFVRNHLPGGLKPRKDPIHKGVVRNTAYVFYNGKLLLVHHKHVDNNELDTNEKKLFDFVGGADGGLFKVDGLTIGLDVCADADMPNNVRQNVITQAYPGVEYDPAADLMTMGLDIHILISDGRASNPPIRSGGYGLHCDRSLSSVYSYNSLRKRVKVNKTSDYFWRLMLKTNEFDAARLALEANLKFKKQ